MIINKKKFIVRLIFVIVWLCLIFFFSNSNSQDSTNQSFGVSRIVIVNSIKITNSIHITNIEMNDENINRIINTFHPYIRKLAHFCEYFILAILVLLMIKETNLLYYYSFTIIFCLLMAIFDEIHQLFIEGRSSDYKDILIDISGCIIYILINKLFVFIKQKKLNNL